MNNVTMSMVLNKDDLPKASRACHPGDPYCQFPECGCGQPLTLQAIDIVRAFVQAYPTDDKALLAAWHEAKALLARSAS